MNAADYIERIYQGISRDDLLLLEDKDKIHVIMKDRKIYKNAL